jgi:endo-1,4-beta-xylanase
MGSRRRLVLALAALWLAAPARALSGVDCGAPGADCSLRDAAVQAGVLVGSAAQPGLLTSDPLYAPALAADFNSLTAENEMKWQALQPSQGQFNFAPADTLVDFAGQNTMTVRGHTLLWADPIRIPDYVNATTDPAALRGLLQDHVSTVASHFAGKVDAWDVVNEPFEVTSGSFRSNVFLDTLGTSYIAETFRLAHAADPGAKLFLNEVLAEFGGAKADALRVLAQDLLAQGVPLHGVGFQTHLLDPFTQIDAAAFEATLRSFADLGLSVEITEMDVALLNNDPDRLQRQRDVYETIVAACLRVAACERITFWGFTDAHTWIDGTFGPGRAPLLLDAAYARKPAWFGVRDALVAGVPEPGLELLLAAALLAARGRARRP